MPWERVHVRSDASNLRSAEPPFKHDSRRTAQSCCHSTGMIFAVKSDRPSASLLPDMRHALRAANPTRLPDILKTVDQLLELSMRTQRFSMTLC